MPSDAAMPPPPKPAPKQMPTSLTTRPKIAATKPKLPPDYTAIEKAAAAKRAAKAAAIATGLANLPGAGSTKLPDVVTVYQPTVAFNFYVPEHIMFWLSMSISALCLAFAFIYTFYGRNFCFKSCSPLLPDRATDLATEDEFTLIEADEADSVAESDAPTSIPYAHPFATFLPAAPTNAHGFTIISRPMQRWMRAFLKITLRRKIARWWGVTGNRLQEDKRRGIIDTHRRRTWGLTGQWLRQHPDPRR
jgi:hypothetical protein